MPAVPASPVPDPYLRHQLWLSQAQQPGAYQESGGARLVGGVHDLEQALAVAVERPHHLLLALVVGFVAKHQRCHYRQNYRSAYEAYRNSSSAFSGPKPSITRSSSAATSTNGLSTSYTRNPACKPMLVSLAGGTTCRLLMLAGDGAKLQVGKQVFNLSTQTNVRGSVTQPRPATAVLNILQPRRWLLRIRVAKFWIAPPCAKR